ncbi:hypothetical protein N9545_03880 [Salibacteraceae bacterium]|jgi:hypothetical protein|nr:hypothetical protein [Salibacteraceae bacterium]MDB4104649.1 hypothetical protein [Salibacteraceae bacterium]MDB9709960.1 hypothetical protein [Salibacteraceae bacterium]MDC1304176.1 hypothetical protein [Salibacteraceae bacterium]
MRFSLRGGYNVTIKKSVKKKDISTVTFVDNYKAQGKWDQLDAGAYFKYKIWSLAIRMTYQFQN